MTQLAANVWCLSLGQATSKHDPRVAHPKRNSPSTHVLPFFYPLQVAAPPDVGIMATHLLFESASGYAIFDVKLKEEVGAQARAVQESIEDLAKFGKMVSLISFSPFKTAAHALENANDVSEGAWCTWCLI